MFGKFTGVAVDDGTEGGFLVVPDGVRVSVRWALLSKVDNRALLSARKKLSMQESERVKLSADVDDWYLCALALSEPIQQWLHANNRSMKEDVYPDDIKAYTGKISPPCSATGICRPCPRASRLVG
ncbi:MAG: hypothetical protein HC888_05450 [Candidatus Competibacteraceae bacterium]|nr:hypothetical protein [Candidatus Competibacteraceae bacterium]